MNNINEEILKKEELVKDSTEVKTSANAEDTFLSDNDESINLVPILSRKEIVVEEKKNKLNISAIFSIIIFLAVTIVIVVFSTISKIQVQNAQKDLVEQEAEVKELSSKILSNEEILKRIYLYNDISSSQYSVKTIFDYFTKIASSQGDMKLDNFDFKSVTEVFFSGKAQSYDQVAKFWYLLDNDKKVDTVILKSVSKSEDKTTFEFQVNMKEGSFSYNLNETKEENGTTNSTGNN